MGSNMGASLRLARSLRNMLECWSSSQKRSKERFDTLKQRTAKDGTDKLTQSRNTLYKKEY